jgi:hypothetical protein
VGGGLSGSVAVLLRHVARLTDDVGIFEHARLSVPRRDNGYCTDDNGRALALTCGIDDPLAAALAERYLAFLQHARDGDRFRLRLGSDRRWTGDAPSDDAHGRALQGLGVAAASAREASMRRLALALFEACAGLRSPHPRSMSHAVLGAHAVLRAHPDNRAARSLLEVAAEVVPRPAGQGAWRWPEPRLGYSNAIIVEALLAIADLAGDAARRDEALGLLDWLVDVETSGDRFSFAPVGGWAPDEPRPAFDQQPIEAWAMADACARALEMTGDPRYACLVERAAAWFDGRNDVGARVYDPATGGGYDGLERDGVNENQGAESTLAYVATTLRHDRIRRGVQAEHAKVSSESSR